MQRIFDDEWAVTGKIWANPYGTRPLSPEPVPAKAGIVMKCLKWPALPRISCLARSERGHAGAAIMNINRP